MEKTFFFLPLNKELICNSRVLLINSECWPASCPAIVVHNIIFLIVIAVVSYDALNTEVISFHLLEQTHGVVYVTHGACWENKSR